MSKAIVLVIDDEADLIELVRYNLEKEGYAVFGAADGESGFARALSEKPDVIVVDLMLPGMDGLEVCRMLRAESATSRIPDHHADGEGFGVGPHCGPGAWCGRLYDQAVQPARTHGADQGAVAALLLRRFSGYPQQSSVLHYGNLSIDSSSHEVRCGTKTLELTATEYRLLQFLASHPGFVYSRATLIDGALGRDVSVLERTIDVHIMSLRRKLGRCGSWIETIRGFGYKFRELEFR